MLFFNRRKRQAEDKAKDKRVQDIRNETFKKIEVAHKSANKLNRLLEKDGGVTHMIFLATGGDERDKHE